MATMASNGFHKHLHNVSNLSVSKRNVLFNYTCSSGGNSNISFNLITISMYCSVNTPKSLNVYTSIIIMLYKLMPISFSIN